MMISLFSGPFITQSLKYSFNTIVPSLENSTKYDKITSFHEKIFLDIFSYFLVHAH